MFRGALKFSLSASIVTCFVLQKQFQVMAAKVHFFTVKGVLEGT
jgi:hypothetical protein